ncbi:MAG: dipeptide epimerase, partial [Rhodothermaceae bacterium]|nr:dipeptide epimerase [Rhodothermaceae bacterium]
MSQSACGTTTGGWGGAPSGNGPAKIILMTITGVETWTDQLPLTRPYVIATRVVSSVDLHFVRLENNLGVFGLGCAAPTAVTAENAEACLGALDACANDIVKGSDPRPLRALIRRLRKECVQYPSAMAAMDMALYDLLARSVGIPVAAMLGQCVTALPTSITIGILPLEETLSEAREYLGRGFRCLKVKLGLNYEEDLERLRALRALCSADIRIRVDANQGYTIEQARQLAHESHALNLELIEQPLARGKEGRLLGLSKEAQRLMAADESLHGPEDALRLAADMPFGIWNIKLMKCGGITGALGI